MPGAPELARCCLDHPPRAAGPAHTRHPGPGPCLGVAQQGGLCVGVHGGGGPRLGPGRGCVGDELRGVRQREAGRQQQHLAVPEDDGLGRLWEAGRQAGGPRRSAGVSPGVRPGCPPATQAPPATLPAGAEGAVAADTVDPGLHELRGEGLRGHQGDAVLWAGPGVEVEAQAEHARTRPHPARTPRSSPQTCTQPEQLRHPLWLHSPRPTALSRAWAPPGCAHGPLLHPPRNRRPSPQLQERDRRRPTLGKRGSRAGVSAPAFYRDVSTQ